MNIKEQIEQLSDLESQERVLGNNEAADGALEWRTTMERLLAVLTDIAEQPIGDEIKLPRVADFEDAYTICVRISRDAVKDDAD